MFSATCEILEVGKWIFCILYRVEILFVILTPTIRWQTTVESRQVTGRPGMGAYVAGRQLCLPTMANKDFPMQLMIT
jgi:hypothetical protein